MGAVNEDDLVVGKLNDEGWATVSAVDETRAGSADTTATAVV